MRKRRSRGGARTPKRGVNFRLLCLHRLENFLGHKFSGSGWWHTRSGAAALPWPVDQVVVKSRGSNTRIDKTDTNVVGCQFLTRGSRRTARVKDCSILTCSNRHMQALTGIVNENIDAPIVTVNFGHHLTHRCLVAHVGRQDIRIRQAGCNLPQSLRRTRNESDPGTLTLCGSSALLVLNHCVDPPRNQCRTALRDSSPKNHPSRGV